MIFDLEDSRTYYTRPMSPAGSRSLDIDRLADGQADVDFSVALAELPRLRSRLAGVDGTVRGRVHFTRERGLAVAELAMSGSAGLQCQRCMGRMEVPVSTSARIALIAAEADIGKVPEDLEPMLAPGGRVDTGDIVEEELMLFLPIVALHEEDSACVADGRRGGAEAPPEEPVTQKPFERLQELLRRRDEKS